MLKQHPEQYREWIVSIHKELGIPEDYLTSTKLPLQHEALHLVDVEHDILDRPQLLALDAAEAWNRMREAAAADGIDLKLVSAFRSVTYQSNLIRKKLDRGEKTQDILKVNTAPGYSEHHTGLAIDLTAGDIEPLTEEFETTEAFAWLRKRAGDFGFSLSYPRDNPYGIVYEPWHWRFRPIAC
jgi:D-alanyl-D-alanine carboxypeptidase